jgi:hypothetical protein
MQVILHSCDCTDNKRGVVKQDSSKQISDIHYKQKKIKCQTLCYLCCVKYEFWREIIPHVVPFATKDIKK